MNPWTWVVEATKGLIEATSSGLGVSLGVAIVLATMLVRGLLIPLTYPLAARTRAWQRTQKGIRPALKAVRKEFKGDPDRTMTEVTRLHADAGIGVVDTAGLWGALIQLPILIAFFQAVLDLPEVQPSGGAILVGLGIGAGALSFLATWLGGQTQSRIFLGGSAVLPVIIVLWLGVGVGFYLIAFYGVTVIQSALIRRHHGA